MKKTLHIDEKLLQEARTVNRAATDTETVRMGLEALVRHAAYERLRALRGTDPTARDDLKDARIQHNLVIRHRNGPQTGHKTAPMSES
jgi:hypothetical protein